MAILFFLSDYHKSALSNLPGVVDDEKALTEILKNYHKKIIKNSTNVLEDLQQIVHECEQKEFERIHFHFSGLDHKLVLSSSGPGPGPGQVQVS